MTREAILPEIIDQEKAALEYIVADPSAFPDVKSVLVRELHISRRQLIALKNRDDGILLNGTRVTVRARLKEGDVISLATEDGDDAKIKIEPSETLPDVIYEDDSVIIMNKPPAMPTHPSHGHHGDTLANCLALYYQTKGIPFVFRPVNRLDRDTSGVVLAAKDQHSASRFYSMMVRHSFEKEYLAVVTGTPEPLNGVIDRPLRRSLPSIIVREVCEPGEGDPSVTEYRTLVSGKGLSVLLVHPKTGRTHQIRVHFASIGTPIVGDTLYGPEEGSDLIGRQALHCRSMTFDHPITGKRICAEAPVPADMLALIDTVKNAVDTVIYEKD